MTYKLESPGSFTILKFQEEIAKQKQKLAEEFKIDLTTISLTSESHDISCTINGREFACYIVTYQIKKDEKIVASLEGYLSNKGEYMEVSVLKP